METVKLTHPTRGRKIIGNTQGTSMFIGTAMLKKLKKLSEFITTFLGEKKKKSLLTSVI